MQAESDRPFFYPVTLKMEAEQDDSHYRFGMEDIHPLPGLEAVAGRLQLPVPNSISDVEAMLWTLVQKYRDDLAGFAALFTTVAIRRGPLFEGPHRSQVNNTTVVNAWKNGPTTIFVQLARRTPICIMYNLSYMLSERAVTAIPCCPIIRLLLLFYVGADAVRERMLKSAVVCPVILTLLYDTCRPACSLNSLLLINGFCYDNILCTSCCDHLKHLAKNTAARISMDSTREEACVVAFDPTRDDATARATCPWRMLFDQIDPPPRETWYSIAIEHGIVPLYLRCVAERTPFDEPRPTVEVIRELFLCALANASKSLIVIPPFVRQIIGTLKANVPGADAWNFMSCVLDRRTISKNGGPQLAAAIVTIMQTQSSVDDTQLAIEKLMQSSAVYVRTFVIDHLFPALAAADLLWTEKTQRLDLREFMSCARAKQRLVRAVASYPNPLRILPSILADVAELTQKM